MTTPHQPANAPIPPLEAHYAEQARIIDELCRRADAETAAADTSTAAGVARWQELQSRHREIRTYMLTKRAVFRGTIAAHFVTGLVALVLWLVTQFIAAEMTGSGARPY